MKQVKEKHVDTKKKKKNNPAVVWILIKEAIHTDRMQFYCCVLKAQTLNLKKKMFYVAKQ